MDARLVGESPAPRLVGFALKGETAPAALYVRSRVGDNFAVIGAEVKSEPILHLKVTWRSSAS